MKRLSLILLWAALVAGVSWVGFEVLVAADATVSEESLSPIIVATTIPAAPTNTGAGGPQAEPTVTSDPAGISTTTTDVTSATSSTATAGSSTTTVATATTTTTSGSPSTSTTTVDAPWETTTISSSGGTLTVRYQPGVVEYLSAAPATGYTLDIEQQTPVVEIEFKREGADVEIKVRWSEGRLDIDIDEEGD